MTAPMQTRIAKVEMLLPLPLEAAEMIRLMAQESGLDESRVLTALCAAHGQVLVDAIGDHLRHYARARQSRN